MWDEAVKLQRPFSQALPQRYWRITWSFTLEPLGARETRLIVRARADFSSQMPGQQLRAMWNAPRAWPNRECSAPG